MGQGQFGRCCVRISDERAGELRFKIKIKYTSLLEGDQNGEWMSKLEGMARDAKLREATRGDQRRWAWGE